MRRKLVRDAVHGDIELEPIEVELMDTAEFQRLRGIKQLGTAALVYPTATHTRFEHSLGTVWMAARMIESLRRSQPIGSEEARAIRIAALLHDITHIPFGHTLEDERRVLPRHDKDEARFAYYLMESPLAGILKRSGYQEEAVRILRGNGGFGSEMISGAITADLLDYLKRDTYFVGFSQNYDVRVFQSFLLDRGRFVVNLEKNGMLRHDALSELINLLRIRYTLSERVYFHHTKLASGAMISKAVELAMASGMKNEDLHTLRDETLLGLLGTRYAGHPAIQHILACLEARHLYKPCYVLTTDIGERRQQEIVRRYHFCQKDREELEAAIASSSGLAPHQVIVYCPSIGMSLPEAEVAVRHANGQIMPLAESNNEEIRVLKEKHKALWKFLIFLDRSATERRDRAAAVAADLLR